MNRIHYADTAAVPLPGFRFPLRLTVFCSTLLLVVGIGLAFNFMREPVYRATARISVEPSNPTEDPALKTQFALSEAQVLRGSGPMQAAIRALAPSADASADLERRLSVEVLPQTSVIELRAEGPDRDRLLASLRAWIEGYLSSRKAMDRRDESEALEEAQHAAREADKNVETKRREMDAFRNRHGIASIEREENPGAARVKGLNVALNDAVTKEVTAEAKVKSIDDSIAQGKAVIRNSDKPAIANLEMRAVDLREKAKDLEHDFTAQYLAHEPRYKALRANLARVEEQIQSDKERSQKAALAEAHEEYSAARRATQRLREQIEGLKQETQAFSTRFVELKRMAADLDAMQDVRKQARDQLSRLESARKPAEAKIGVLATPSAGESPIAPDYGRDAALILAAGVLLATALAWLVEYLTRESTALSAAPPPVIQIAYPVLGAPPVGASSMPTPLLSSTAATLLTELAERDVSALWANATDDGRLIVSALFAGIAPDELVQLRWKHVRLDEDSIDVPGAFGRRLRLLDPLRETLRSRSLSREADRPEAFVLADALGNSVDEASVDRQLRFTAHDAGLHHPEDVTAESLHFTYAAFLARQGMRMTDLCGVLGRLTDSFGTELMRLAPPGGRSSASTLELLHPSFRAA